MSDPFIIVTGGLVSNDPSLPVFDLDVLDSSFVDPETVEEVKDLSARLEAEAVRHEKDSPAWVTLYELVEQCDLWLSQIENAKWERL